MKKVEIHEIEFEEDTVRLDADEYPNGGLFIAKRGRFSDLVFVNKKDKFVTVICPEFVFNETTKVEQITELPKTENKFDGDFILEFSRILLNRK